MTTKREDTHALLAPDMNILAKQEVTLSVLIIDRSGSMHDYQDSMKEAVNSHIQDLSRNMDGREYYCAVISFADEMRVDLPFFYVRTVPKFEVYHPDGLTLQYETVEKVISGILENFEKLSSTERNRFKIFFGVFTDGEDNQSDKNLYPEKLQSVSRRARELSCELLTFGFGVDAPYIAELMGFPTDEDHAVTVEKSTSGITQATRHYTSFTSTGSPRGPMKKNTPST
ncbi:MAG TPA: vWA domain-containing protein [Patescibacteria group bacterium]|nr:vWA domain-containing protein [Patescibacteria group bacterium]